jgi:BirA family biotin operon repressor/biotin-[acetyl-CoA-carboxylase] ligase
MPEENIQIKWPNDIYVNQKKIAGILIENQIKGNQIAASIIGIGLNVNESDFPENLSMAVSMIKYTKRIINPSELLPKICSKLETNLEWIKKNGPNHFLKAYLGKMYRFDTLSDYIYEGKRIRACIIGIDEYGRLLLKKQNTIITCDVREISFV